MKTFQNATSLQDFEQFAAKATNMVDGEVIVHRAAEFIGNQSTEWKREFCAKNLGRFTKTNMYKILMGEVERDGRQYHYTPYAF